MTGKLTHGHTSGPAGSKRKSPTYITWLGMRSRCRNKNADNYGRYGGEGICVSDRWYNSFECFLEDMGERPDGHTLDRIDGSGNYEIDNCRWAAFAEQARNSDNYSKGWRRNNTHCPQGHSYSGRNLIIREQGYRRCRLCQNEQARNRRRLRGKTQT